MQATQNRIKFLDGLRGLAILAVVLRHAYGDGFSSYLPYGTRYDIFPVTQLWVGVELFFMISGFVILMTLEKSANFITFIKRRWLRLFPAMFIASIVIFAFNSLTNLGPFGHRHLLDLLPGLTFINPGLIRTVTRIKISSMDGPFWSLYVEALFYVVFGATYFALGSRWAIAAIVSMNVISYLIWLIFGNTKFGDAMNWLGFEYMLWFASGAVFYLYYLSKKASYFMIAVALGITVAIFSKSTSGLLFLLIRRIG